MNTRNKHIAFLLLAVMMFQACASPGVARRGGSVGGLDITARGAIGPLDAALVGPMYTGDGGRYINLAILAPDVQGDVPDFLPLYIQGMLNNNINRFSSINLIDRQNLNMVIAEQDLVTGGRFSDEDFIRIGHIANAQYLLLGTIQRLPGNRYSLQFSITEASTGMRRATFMRDGTLEQIEGRGILLSEATAELLEQLGIRLTESGRQALLAGNVSIVQAEAGLARGIIAQAGGDEVAALFNFAQAVSFDPAQLEALSRLNTISTTISDGTISQRILNDIQARDQWVDAFRESARFFNDHPPFEITFDPSLIQIGETDFVRRTVNLGMRIALDPSEAGFGALNTLLEGLERTGRRNAWGFSGWPLMDISPRTAGTVVFNGRRSFRYTVNIAIVNENNITLATNSITLDTEPLAFSAGQRNISPPGSVIRTVNFPNIRIDNLTPTLTIVIVSVNRIRAHDLIASSYIRVEANDLETRFRTLEEAERLGQQQRETAERLEQQRLAEAERRQAETDRLEQQRREQELAQQRQRHARWWRENFMTVLAVIGGVVLVAWSIAEAAP